MWPRRRPGEHMRLRWISNVEVWALSVGLTQALFPPLLGVSVSLVAADRGFGLFNAIQSPAILGWIVTALALDVAKYAEHRAFHRVGLLWRIHRMHHTDVEFDVTLGLRFHPIEAVLSTGFTLAVIGVLGLPAPAVATWHVVALVNGAFAHGNVRMPRTIDRILRVVTVTPDMHRIHHSAVPVESGRNLGSVFPWWDHLFRTYVAEPAAGLDAMRIGVEEFAARKHLTLPWMLAHPFLRVPASDQRLSPTPKNAAHVNG